MVQLENHSQYTLWPFVIVPRVNLRAEELDLFGAGGEILVEGLERSTPFGRPLVPGAKLPLPTAQEIRLVLAPSAVHGTSADKHAVVHNPVQGDANSVFVHNRVLHVVVIRVGASERLAEWGQGATEDGHILVENVKGACVKLEGLKLKKGVKSEAKHKMQRSSTETGAKGKTGTERKWKKCMTVQRIQPNGMCAV